MEVDAPRVADELTQTALVRKIAEQHERTLRDYARKCLAMSDEALMLERNRLLSDPDMENNTNILQYYYIVSDLAKARGLAGSDVEDESSLDKNEGYHHAALVLGAIAVFAFGYQLLGNLLGAA